ncbi:hypothetical protein [Gilvimarinus chinensis]|uniref:hypothetical protein n=1 Tax=Gilvimarinus chinensis TaxID=396005 RepID=UPI00037C21E0|nr:hypothetical protein [Gilvimarinus chinensis]
MKLTTQVENHVTPKALAKTLAEATPEDFAQFWFEFAELTEKSPETIQSFAKAMASDFGAKRKAPLKKLVSIIEYHEIKDSEGLY